MGIKVEGYLKPFGKPIARAVIVVTTLGKSKSLKNTYVRRLTESDGWYSFLLEKGMYLIEYKQNRVLTEVGRVYVTDETPNVITLEELVRTSPVVDIPKSKTDNVDWENELNTHNSLAVFDKDFNQATKEDAHSIDYEEASVSTIGNKGRRSDKVESSNGYVESSTISFSKEGDTLLETNKEFITPTFKENLGQSVSDTNTLKVEKHNNFSTPTITYKNKYVLEESSTSVNQEKTDSFVQEGYQKLNYEALQYSNNKLVKDLTAYSVEGNFGNVVVNYEKNNSLENGYINASGVYVNYPRQVKKESTKFTYPDNTSTNPTPIDLIEDTKTSSTRITSVGEVEVKEERTLTVLGNTYISRLIHTGFRNIKEYLVDLFRVGDTFEVDNRAKKVTIKGKLEIENRDDFIGDTIFQVFQYSRDGLTDWQDEFDPALVWRRHNMSINGFINPLTWSKAYLLVAQDGEEGDTIYIEYEYSADRLSWSKTFRNGDIWRRERTVINGVPTSDWSTPSRIRGFDGNDGDTIYIEYQYSIDGLFSWHSNFSTGDHYRRERLVVNGIAKEWSVPAKIVPEKEEDYFDGYNNTIVQLYIRSTSVPTAPTVDSIYNFETAVLTGYNNGWSQSVPSGTAPIYVIAASASSTTITDIITPDDWSSPVLLAQSGDTIYPEYQYSPDGINNWHSDFFPTDYFRRERTVVVTPTGVNVGNWSSGVRIRQDGEDGYTPRKGVDYFDGRDGSFHSFIYRLSDTVPPNPIGGTYNGAVETFPNGWFDDPMYSTTSLTWVSKTIYRQVGDEWVHEDWSTPVQWLGKDGENGVNTAQINLYIRSDTTPESVTSTSKYNFTTGVLTGHNNGWSRTIPAGTAPIWIISAMAVSLLKTDIIEAGDWSDPVILAQNGEDGKDGIDGRNGLHGNGSYIIRLDNPDQARTNDTQLDNDILVLANREPQVGDILTYELTNPTASDNTFPRRYLRGASNVSSMGFNAWEGFAFVLNGNALINGTVATEALKTEAVTADKVAVGVVEAINNFSKSNNLFGWRSNYSPIGLVNDITYLGSRVTTLAFNSAVSTTFHGTTRRFSLEDGSIYEARASVFNTQNTDISHPVDPNDPTWKHTQQRVRLRFYTDTGLPINATLHHPQTLNQIGVSSAPVLWQGFARGWEHLKTYIVVGSANLTASPIAEGVAFIAKVPAGTVRCELELSILPSSVQTTGHFYSPAIIKVGSGEVSARTLRVDARVIVGTGNEQAGINGLDADQWTGWRFWSGHSNPNLAPFRVDRHGNSFISGEAGFGAGGSYNGYNTFIHKNGLVQTNNLQAHGGQLRNLLIDEDCTIKGHLDGASGNFKGTVEADKIIGDIAKANIINLSTQFPNLHNLTETLHAGQRRVLFSCFIGGDETSQRWVKLDSDWTVTNNQDGAETDRYFRFRAYFNGQMVGENGFKAQYHCRDLFIRLPAGNGGILQVCVERLSGRGSFTSYSRTVHVLVTLFRLAKDITAI